VTGASDGDAVLLYDTFVRSLQPRE